MRLISLLILMIQVVVSLTAQNLDHLMTRRYINCQDIEYNCSFLIPEFYRSGKTDSLNYILDYWETRCGYNDLLFQTRTLLDIQQDKFNETGIDKTLIFRLINYGQNSRHNRTAYRWNYYRYDFTNGFFRNFLDSLSSELANKNLSETENFLISFYNGSAKLNDLKDKYVNSKLSEYYSQFIDSVLRAPEFTISVYTGLFIPTQSAAILGNHGLIGVGFGGLFYRNSIDLLLDFKFGPPKEHYNVLYRDSVITSEIFTGMYIGLEYGRAILIKNKSEYFINVGIGGERITAVTKDEEKDKDAKFLWSSAYSFGLGYRYRYNFKNSISFQLRYQYLDYNNPSGTRLNGNGFTIRLIWVSSSNQMRNTLSTL